MRLSRLSISLNKILYQISENEYRKLLECVANTYKTRGYHVDNNFLVDFFETNYSTGEWYKSLKNSLSQSNYSAIDKMIDDDWEKADEVGVQFGDYIVEKFLKI